MKLSSFVIYTFFLVATVPSGAFGSNLHDSNEDPLTPHLRGSITNNTDMAARRLGSWDDDGVMHTIGDPVEYTERIHWSKGSTFVDGWTSNCGMYGCRVMRYPNQNRQLPAKAFHGGGTQMVTVSGFWGDHWFGGFTVHKQGNSGYGGEIRFGDRVIIRADSEVHPRKLKERDGRMMKFATDSFSQATWMYVRPPPNSSLQTGDVLTYGQEFVLARSSDTDDSGCCGWYGYKVLKLTGSLETKLDHGGTNPTTWVFF